MDFFHEALRRFSGIERDTWSRKQIVDELVSIELELYLRTLYTQEAPEEEGEKHD